ncbi:hypothetical protein AX17_006914 [Amanita inopinata Kibby_2008]|nr:hypothetical protein AX17_006914 [Amanita inopinata Kibby_2008]
MPNMNLRWPWSSPARHRHHHRRDMTTPSSTTSPSSSSTAHLLQSAPSRYLELSPDTPSNSAHSTPVLSFISSPADVGSGLGLGLGAGGGGSNGGGPGGGHSGTASPHGLHAQDPSSEPGLSRRPSVTLLHHSHVESLVESPDEVRGGTSFLNSNILATQPALTSTRTSPRPWKETPRKHWFVPMVQTMMYEETRKRVAQAVACTLHLVGDATHGALLAGVELLEMFPIPVLGTSGRLLLQIWDVVQQAAFNRMRCLRLAMRSADLLISIREEISTLNDVVERVLQQPLRIFEETLTHILESMQRQIGLPGWERYLKKEELREEIDNCSVALTDCVNTFDRSVMLRIIDNIVRHRRQSTQLLLLGPEAETPNTLDRLDIPVISLPNNSSNESEEQKMDTWHRLVEEDDEIDNARDDHDLHVLLEHAVYACDEAQVIRLLQIGQTELPTALKAFLKEAFEMKRLRDEERASHQRVHRVHGKAGARTRSWPTSHPVSVDKKQRRQGTRDDESIWHGMESMRRESRGLPAVVRSWAIVKDDVRLGDIIGRGHFSTVYKGIWRGRTVAIKVLNPGTASKSYFKNELTVWRQLSSKGGNVLKIYGSSTFAGGLPRILISPYMRNGNLSDYMKRCEWEETGNTPSLFLLRGSYTNVDHLKLMHDVALGMEFLHGNGVLHGDLRAENIIVTDHFECVLSDFGFSKFEMQVTFEDPAPNRSFDFPNPWPNFHVCSLHRCVEVASPRNYGPTIINGRQNGRVRVCDDMLGDCHFWQYTVA